MANISTCIATFTKEPVGMVELYAVYDEASLVVKQFSGDNSSSSDVNILINLPNTETLNLEVLAGEVASASLSAQQQFNYDSNGLSDTAIGMGIKYG